MKSKPRRKRGFSLTDREHETSATYYNQATKGQQMKDTQPAISLHQLQTHADDIRAELSLDQSEPAELTTKYLGKKGRFNALAQVIRNVAPEDRKQAGQILNHLKEALEKHIAKVAAEQDSSLEWTDMTVPGLQPMLGHMHPVSQAMEEVTRIFERIGFTRVRYPEVDWDHYVFEALNMPPNHPARDEWETFFVDAPIDKKFGKVVLTTHTSNGQVREMERHNSQPPIRMINIARCYRRQQDATHTQMFHQFEGLVVDKGITIQHLKGTLDYFAQEFYGPGTKSRIRPFHFQFTEPSFEVDFSCHICHGTGMVDGNVKCKFCKSGWHEVGGAGMVHPNVLKAGGIDPEEYTGFAFGWGVERTYTLKPGLNIDDIRLFYSGEMRFLEQF
jgi:phenylalanyl-tRNA synthetase alpha chain